MAQRNAIVDTLLTNVSSAYVPEGYVSERFLPRINVKQESGLLGKYGDSHLRIEVPTRIDGEGKARRVKSITRETSQYIIEKHGLEGIVTDSDRRNVEKPFDAERDEVIGLSTMIWLAKENALASQLTDTAVLTQNTTLSGASQYGEYATSDPIDDFKTARETVYNSVGMPPDTAIMPWPVMNCLAYHPGILESLGFAQNRAGQLSEVELAKALGVKRLLVAMAQKNSAAEGQTDVRASVWNNDIIFAVAPKSPQVFQVSVGYYLSLSGIAPRQVTKYSINNPPRSTGIIVEDAFDMFLSNPLAGYLIKDAIA